MIKKFEEFVNEMYTSRANIGKELVAYLSELGVSESDCSEIYALAQKRRAPIAAILFVDFFIVKKQKISLKDYQDVILLKVL